MMPPPLGANIRGSCRGFVLLDPDYHFFVWNPSTGFHKRVPYFPMSSQFFPFIHGLGYDASDDDYLVVLGAYDPSDADFKSDFQVFSMKANSWKKIGNAHNFPYMNAIDDPRAGLFLNEAIHWLAFRHDTEVELILAFNVTQRKFTDIPLPDDFFQNLEFTYLGTLGGCLSLSVLGDDEVEIWLMKEYGARSSWTKSMVVSVEIPGDYFFPICLTKNGEIVGSDYSDGGKGLVKCNDKGKVLEYLEYVYEVHEDNAIVYTESLLSLPCDSGEEDEQQE
ncbi:F-box/kelch-repeat protein At3g06240-like isoform X2 [Neltuma alba]|nr:F-box/kelch-repeat protein At3g06240-like isoform X2 [Prosopis alba]